VAELVIAQSVEVQAGRLEHSFLAPIALERAFARVVAMAVNLEHHAVLGPEGVDKEAVQPHVCLWFRQVGGADQFNKQLFEVGARRGGAEPLPT
jgi:hypothetical protein